MMRMPRIPTTDGNSPSRSAAVPTRKSGVNESIGIESEISEDESARKVRMVPRNVQESSGNDSDQGTAAR